ncbi:tyrosine-protein phosphatase [Gordonia sp. zg691]|uniref:Tyrosine-protein phosphatase n=1 Tax=Gordonia jinghuaiqii TaxID=2758710 RepID=A0A7D7LTZ5_9ACTN|nr:tyrosine-protein phosphatase [Gordonia jinghuaiqii]MBD0861606.1 tyrosine-protein phosphatase [Gordonia jinghuaiqii]QMT02177.1 tyrosine-protein phosphatase [Gordonia jinghuaiqii]
MTATPGAPSPIASLPNLRDVGGWPTVDGRVVRSGMLFRSTDFSSLDAADVAPLEALGLRTIFDLRSAHEREAIPDPALPGVANIGLDVLADAQMSIPANIGAVLADPAVVAQADEALSGGKARDMICGTYREMITLPSSTAAYTEFFRGLAGDTPTPALVHCTTGKDRTGWAAAAFLTLMGVSKDDVYRDYLLTNERLIPALKPIFDGFAAAGGDPELLVGVLGVDAGYLDAAFDEVHVRFGGIEGYFDDALGLGADEQEKLRARFLST